MVSCLIKKGLSVVRWKEVVVLFLKKFSDLNVGLFGIGTTQNFARFCKTDFCGDDNVCAMCVIFCSSFDWKERRVKDFGGSHLKNVVQADTPSGDGLLVRK